MLICTVLLDRNCQSVIETLQTKFLTYYCHSSKSLSIVRVLKCCYILSTVDNETMKYYVAHEMDVAGNGKQWSRRRFVQ